MTAAAGLFDPTSKALGVTVLDFDLDGWPDLFVANDTQPNKLYRNRRDRTFQEVGVQAGLAFSEDGRARAGMGTDAADLDNSGLPSLAVTNFSGEMLGLYVPVKPGVYADRAPGSAVGKATRHTLGFGCFFFDADLDGLLDLLVVNGHIDDRVAADRPRELCGSRRISFTTAARASSSTSPAKQARSSHSPRSAAARRSAISIWTGTSTCC